MAFASEFKPLPLEQLHREAAVLKTDGWRFIQTHAVNTEAGVDLYYSFMKDLRIVNYRVEGVKPGQAVPSITDLFLAAFVFENEARELFGVDMRDIALDFDGAMYAPAERSPMTFISPEQKAAREKAKKAAAAKAEKAATASQDSAPVAGTGMRKRLFIMTPERRARLDAKLKTMSPEKVAKVEAAVKARAAEVAAAEAAAAGASAEAPTPEPAADAQEPAKASPAPPAVTAEAKDTVLEAKLASMDPEKAAKVRAAIAGKEVPVPAAASATSDEPGVSHVDDPQLEQLLGLMDDAKANVVRSALSMKGGE